MLIDFIAIFLIEWLGHDSFKQREVAHYVVIQYNNYFDCRQVISYSAANHPDAEVRLRCRKINKRYTLLDPAAGYYPRLDWMNYADNDEIGAILANNRTNNYPYYEEPESYSKDQKYRNLSKQYALSLLKSGLTRYQVRDIMDREVNAERKEKKFPIKKEGVLP